MQTNVSVLQRYCADRRASPTKVGIAVVRTKMPLIMPHESRRRPLLDIATTTPSIDLSMSEIDGKKAAHAARRAAHSRIPATAYLT